jgi:hypothetical protein
MSASSAEPETLIGEPRFAAHGVGRWGACELHRDAVHHRSLPRTVSLKQCGISRRNLIDRLLQSVHILLAQL